MSQRSNSRRDLPAAARVFGDLQADDALAPGGVSAVRKTGALFLAFLVLGVTPLFLAAYATGVIGDPPAALAKGSNSGPGSGDDDDSSSSGPGSGGGGDDDTGTHTRTGQARGEEGTDDTSRNGHSTRGTTNDNDTNTRLGTDDTSRNNADTRGTTNDNDTNTNTGTHTRTGGSEGTGTGQTRTRTGS